MKLIPAGLGAEPKKIALLAVILVGGGGYAYYSNTSDQPPGGAPVKQTNSSDAATKLLPAPPPATSSGPRIRTRSKGKAGDDFHPSLVLPDNFDLSHVDPTVHMDLLAKVRAVPEQPVKRSLFEFYVPPPPEIKIVPIYGPKQPPPPPPPPSPPPPLPPKVFPAVPLKFFGYAGSPGSRGRKGYFLVGEDDIRLVGENDVIDKKYKIVRLGVADCEVEDIPNENHRSTIPLTPEIPG